MKKQTILALLCITTFMFSLYAQGGVAAPTITGQTFSNDIRAGNHMRWEVTFTNDSQPVTTVGNDGPPFVDGSVLNVWVNQDPYGTNFTDPTQQLMEQYFSMSIDGNNTVNGDVLPGLVFPNVYWVNGADYSAFHYTYDYGTLFPLFDTANSPDYTIQYYSFFTDNNGDHMFNATQEYHHSDGRVNIDTFIYFEGSGVLQSYTHIEHYNDGTMLYAQVYLTNYDQGDDFLRYAQFDSSLNPGDSFSWDVLQSKTNGSDVTTLGDNGPPSGSVVRIDIVGQMENINFTQDINPEDYFHVYLDGNQLPVNDTFKGPGDFVQFIFPYHFDFGNGTTLNFFEYASAHPTEVWSPGSTGSISNGVFTAHIIEFNQQSNANYTSTTDVSFNTTNGVMMHLHRTETSTDGSTSEIELLRQGVNASSFVSSSSSASETGSSSQSSSNSSGAGLPLPGFELYMILPALIAIPIIRMRRNQ